MVKIIIVTLGLVSFISFASSTEKKLNADLGETTDTLIQNEESQADKEKFWSLNTGLNFVFNESIGFWGLDFEYGQDIIQEKNYKGFYTIGATFTLDGPGFAGVDFEYGYEFWRDKLFSFGFNTFHSLGMTTAYASSGFGFGNAIGSFVKAGRSVSFLLQAGVRHKTPFQALKKELIANDGFGPYIHLGICYSWL